MQKFELLLQNEKISQYRLFAFLIIILSLVLLVAYAIVSSEFRFKIIAVIVIVSVFFIIENSGQNKRNYFNARTSALLLITFAYFHFHLLWGAGIMSFLAVLYFISVRKLTVIVNEKHITYPSVIKKNIEWKELNNLILKDGLLTIDFKSNKVIQQLTANKGFPINEKEFNDFCREQLKKHTKLLLTE